MPTFNAKLTAAGLALYTAAIASGIPVRLITMAVGDGNGNPTIPSQEQTALVREVFRRNLSSLTVSENDSSLQYAEMIIPPDIGGWTIREVGLFTIDGTLFAVANFPETYKPLISDGSSRDLVIKFGIKLSNASSITVVVDPNIATATRAWVLSTVTAALLIPGGFTNQVLAKESNADGDLKWVDLGEINVVVDVIEERQTLAASQTDVNMAVTSTRGLAVYIEGVRINSGTGADEWLPGPGEFSLTRIVLGRSYPAGTIILMVQNEPAGAQRRALEQVENLADLPNKALARTNLDVFSKAEATQLTPPSAILHFARASAPTGWLKANGAAVNRFTYDALFAAIGTTFGSGDGANTFNLPDLRGEFLRGFDDGRGLDVGRVFGSVQGGQNLSHGHGITIDGVAAHNHNNGIFTRLLRPPFPGSLTGSDTDGSGSEQAVGRDDSTDILAAGAHTHSATINFSGGSENRPRNAAMLACIKY